MRGARERPQDRSIGASGAHILCAYVPPAPHRTARRFGGGGVHAQRGGAAAKASHAAPITPSSQNLFTRATRPKTHTTACPIKSVRLLFAVGLTGLDLRRQQLRADGVLDLARDFLVLL